MTKKIAIINQKGGVGKTTTAINLSASFSYYDFHTVVIDLDPQGNTTSGLGLSKQAVQSSIYDVLIEDKDIAPALHKTSVHKLSLLPSNSDLLSAEWQLASLEEGNTMLKRKLMAYLESLNESERPKYILFDCPPSMGPLTLNAILACDSIIIPVQCEYYALEGLTEILNSCTMVRNTQNPNITLEGILLTMADRRLNLSRQVEEEIRSVYKEYVLKTVINRNVRLSEAPSHGVPIIIYDPISHGAGAYLSLAQEVMENETKSPRSWPIGNTV